MSAWGKTEDTNLRACAGQGMMALCYLLRRPPSEIRDHARELQVAIVEPYHNTASLPDKLPRGFYDLMELYGSVQAELCPRCGSGIIVPWHPGGKLGICPACYRRAEKDALEEANTEALLKRDKDRIKKQTQRLREETGTNPRKGPGAAGRSTDRAEGSKRK